MGFVGPVINGLLLTQISELKLVTLTHVSQPRNFLGTVFVREQFWDLFCFCYILLRFLKKREFWSSNANWHLRFSLGSIILEDLFGNRSLLQCIQKVMVCDLWLADFADPFCVFLCFKVPVHVIVIMIDGSEKRICEDSFWTSEFVARSSKALLRLTRLPNEFTNKKDVRRWYQLCVY